MLSQMPKADVANVYEFDDCNLVQELVKNSIKWKMNDIYRFVKMSLLAKNKEIDEKKLAFSA